MFELIFYLVIGYLLFGVILACISGIHVFERGGKFPWKQAAKLIFGWGFQLFKKKL